MSDRRRQSQDQTSDEPVRCATPLVRQARLDAQLAGRESGPPKGRSKRRRGWRGD